MTEVKETIHFTPSRGIEQVTEVYKSEINLYPNHIEIVQSYDYIPFMPEDNENGQVRGATIYPKTIAVEISSSYHEKDPQKTLHPTVRISFDNWEETLHLKTEKEAYQIYTKLKLWLINE